MITYRYIENTNTLALSLAEYGTFQMHLMCISYGNGGKVFDSICTTINLFPAPGCDMLRVSVVGDLITAWVTGVDRIRLRRER